MTPPFRCFTTDNHGIVKVIQCSTNNGIPAVVSTWGDASYNNSIVDSSFSELETNSGVKPLLAVAMKNGQVNLMNGHSGNSLTSFPTESMGGRLIGVHVFGNFPDLKRGDFVVLTYTRNKKASLTTIEQKDGSLVPSESKTWDLFKAGHADGDIQFGKVHASERYFVCGGKTTWTNNNTEAELLRVYDFVGGKNLWTAAHHRVRASSSNPRVPLWFTSVTFLRKSDHREFLVGSNDDRVLLYNVNQRTYANEVVFEAPRALEADLDENTLFVGSGLGDVKSIDLRRAGQVGEFVDEARPCGSITSIVRHPRLPIIASCGLDKYVRIWDINTRELLFAVYLERHVTSVVFDSNFSDQERDSTRVGFDCNFSDQGICRAPLD